MSELIDRDRRGGVLRTLPVASIRYSTEAAVSGNTAVVFRLAAPTVCQMDWGDGNIDFIRSEDFTCNADKGASAYEYTYTYATAGIYNATLYSIAGVRPQLATARTREFWKPIKPANLCTRIEILTDARYFGYFCFCMSTPYLTQVIFPAGQGLGSNGDIVEQAFAVSGITSLPECSFTSIITSLRYLCAEATNLTSVSALLSTPTAQITEWSGAFQGCRNLLSFPLVDTSGGTVFAFTWYENWALTSFPLINTSNGTNFDNAWAECRGLTSFPLIDLSSATTLQEAWESCSVLTTFPLVNVSNVTNFIATWRGCRSLVEMPAINCAAGVAFFQTWYNCTSLTTFPAGVFNGCAATIFNQTFLECPLTAASVDNILISIESNGTSNGNIDLTGGAAPTGAGVTAKTALQSRGWTVLTS